MTVKDIIKEACVLTGENDLYNAIDSTITDQTLLDKLNLFLKAFNIILNEIATEYYPITNEQTFSGGKVMFSSFTYEPKKILKAYDGKGEVWFKVFPTYILLPERSVTVQYEYIPADKAINDTFPYEKSEVGKRIFSYGISAEYCLVSGRYQEADNWETKYRFALKRNSKIKNTVIKARNDWGL